MKVVKRCSTRYSALLALVVLCLCNQALAEEMSGGGKLSLELPAFSQPNFKVGDGEAQPLMQDSELNPAFLELLSPYPEAVAAAKKSQTYGGQATTGSVLILLGTVLVLMDTLNDKEDLENNQFPEEEDDHTGEALALILGGGVLGIIANSNIKSNLNRAVQIYNERSGHAALEPFKIDPSVAAQGASFNMGLTYQNSALNSTERVQEPAMMAMFNYRF